MGHKGLTLVCSYYREVPKKILSPEDAVALSEIAMDQDTLRFAPARDRESYRERERQSYREIERQRELQRNRETGSNRESDREIEKERRGEREREREREIQLS